MHSWWDTITDETTFLHLEHWSRSLHLLRLPARAQDGTDAGKSSAACFMQGCSGRKMEQETEASGVYEVDAAKRQGGRYDIKLGKGFEAVAIISD